VGRGGLGISKRLQPGIEILDPVIAAGALHAQAKAMAARLENVGFGPATGG
jgi:hypothetical protein